MRLEEKKMSNPILFIALIILLAIYVIAQHFEKRTELKNINKKLTILTSEIKQDREDRKKKENYDG